MHKLLHKLAPHFLKNINAEFQTHEDLMELKSLETSKKYTDIFNVLNNVISKYGCFVKCSGIATDGAKRLL